jgi:hypothetical protein
MLSRLKFDIEGLFQEIYDERFPEYIFTRKGITFADLQCAGLQSIIPIVNKLRKNGHSDDYIRSHVFAFCEDELDLNSIQFDFSDVPVTFDIYKDTINMKFDVLVGNDPYQQKVGDKNTEPLWDKFFLKRMSLLKDNGFLCLIHPSGWRNIDGRFKNIQKVIRSKKVSFLSIHNEKDGKETFGAETRYDYYVLQNVPCDNSETTIRFQDGHIKKIVLDNMEFIPNGGIDLLNKLIAKNGEDTVNLIHDESSYAHRKKYMSKEMGDGFIYPCVYTVNNLHQPKIWYSEINNKGHFGIPKIIWSNGRISSVGSFIDTNGEYGLMEYSYAIVDTLENLENIKRVFDSKKFKDFMELCAVGMLTINHKVVSTFKKDFWKEFVNE